MYRSFALLASLPLFAQIPVLPPGGAPGRGSGDFALPGPVRVIDGDTLEVYIRGSQVGVGLIGVRAPMGNTACGQAATGALWGLVKGGVTLEEDPSITFDSRIRRMYHVKVNGQSLALEMVKRGLAKAVNEGRDAGLLMATEGLAQSARAGCLWSAGGATSLPALKSSLQAKADSVKAPAASLEPLSVSAAPGFTVENVISGLSLPTDFRFAPDGRIFVTEQRGLVRIIKNGVLLSTPFIDISSQVNNYWDRGLISLALDPNFPTSPYVYLYHTYENDPADFSGTKTGRLIRVTASGDLAVPGSQITILGSVVGKSCNDFAAGADCVPSDGPSHSVGGLVFAPDGTLFVTAGDAAVFNIASPDSLRSQNLDLLAGKLLRITSTGQGVAGNPFWDGNPNSNRSKVWAYGLRNSFRVTLMPPSNVPVVGDVGWDTWEEVNGSASSGRNFGWPCYEGPAQQSGFSGYDVCNALYLQGSSAVRNPSIAWNHFGVSAAAVGGTFYTGTNYPSQFYGAFFYGDYGQSVIRYATLDSNVNLTAGPAELVNSADGPVSIRMGPDGNLYYSAIATGQIRRIRYTAPTSGDTYLSDINWTSMTNGWGSAEKNLSNGEALTNDGTTITIGGTPFTKGLGVHAPSEIHYALNGTCSSFAATIGVDDEVGSNGSVVFQVWADGTQVYSSPTLTGVQNGVQISANVTGKSDLRLVVSDAGDGAAYDHADWANARITCSSGTDTTPPSVTGKSPAAGQTGVALASDVAATFSEAIDLVTLTPVNFNVRRSGASTPEQATITYDSPSRTARLALGSMLQSGTQYVVTVKGGTSGVRDLAGNTPTSDTTWTFTTTTTVDTTPPTVQSVTPSANAIDVPASTSVQVIFSEPMLASSINATNVQIAKPGASPIPAAVSYDAVANKVSLFPSVMLEAGTVYTVTVRGGSSGVKDVSGNFLAANFIVSFTTEAPVVYLSDQPFISATNGWGPPERDMSNGESLASDGVTISIDGTPYAKGLGVHANSDLRFSIGSSCTSFRAVVGIDDEVGNAGSAIFKVLLNGVVTYTSPLLTGTSAGLPIQVDVTGKSEIGLVVDGGPDGTGTDHSDWASARLVCGTSNHSPTPVISSPTSATRYRVGDVINFSGSASDQEDGTIPVTKLDWTILIQHCPGGICHTHPFQTLTGAGGTLTIPDHGDSSYFQLKLTATDSGGAASTVQMDLLPLTVQLTLDTLPTGLTVNYGGESGPAPLVRTTIAGSSHSISTATPQGSYNFVSWSDGGALQHNVVVNSNLSLLANFQVPVGTSGLSPANGATGVAASTSVSAMFSANMNASTITTSTFTLTRVSTGSPVTSAVSFNSANRTATLQPSAALAAGAQYLAKIIGGSAGVKDSAGNPLSSDVTWSFTVANASTPIVTATSPVTGATGVALGSNVRAVFSEAMSSASLTTSTFSLVILSSGQTVNAVVNYDSTSNTATLLPGAALQASTTYRATLKGGPSGVTNLSGNPLAADYTWSFTTAAASAPPVYLSDLQWTSAVNGWGPPEKDLSNGETLAGDGKTLTLNGATFAKGIGVHAASDVRFAIPASCTGFRATIGVDDEVGSAGSVIFKVLLDGTLAYTSPLLTGDAASVNLQLDFANKSAITLQVDGGTDGIGSDHADWADARLVCGSSNTTLAVSSTNPSNGATGVGSSAGVSAVFSSDVNASTVSASTFTLTRVSTGSTVASTVSYSSGTRTVTLQPTAALVAGAQYQARIVGGTSGVKDTAGNPLPSDVTWLFTVAAASSGPNVTTTSPVAGAVGVALNTDVRAVFSESMSSASFTGSTFSLVVLSSGQTVNAIVNYDSTSNTATLRSSAALLASTTYKATLKGGSSGVKNLSGTPLAADYTWSFTTTAPGVYLSDLQWTSAVNGWGPPEKDLSNGETLGGDGKTITLNGTTYAKGLGVHAASDVRFAIPTSCTGFRATVGVDDEVGSSGSVIFKVLLDGVAAYTSPLLTGVSDSVNVQIDFTGKSVIALQVDGGTDGVGSDHADWADARLICGASTTASSTSTLASNEVSQ